MWKICVCVHNCTYIMQDPKKNNLPTNLPTTKTQLKKTSDKMSEASHSFFSPQPQPPKRCAFKTVSTSLHRITSRFSTRPDTSRRLTLGHSGSTRHSQNFLEKNPGHRFPKLWAGHCLLTHGSKVSIDIITRNQGWVFQLEGNMNLMPVRYLGMKWYEMSGDVGVFLSQGYGHEILGGLWLVLVVYYLRNPL